MPPQKRKKKARHNRRAHLGGRATAAGVNYESRIAALVAVHMLGGDKCVLWENLTGGDIVSDLCAGLVGGLGFAPSANLGDNYAVFEPTHGSAPKYAGQYKVNPIAMLLTAKLMLDWLKETEMATRLETAVARVIAEGKVRTYDMGGKASTLDVAKAIADYASS